MPKKTSTFTRCKNCAFKCCRGLRFLLLPSLVTYFAQSGGIYVLNGLYTYLNMGAVQQILCKIPGEYNATQGQTVGCSNCTDNLLMCGKSKCYQYAMNASIKLKKDGSRKSWPDMFDQAVQDKECSLKIAAAHDPIDGLVQILAQREITAGSPGDKCVQWHCQVMMLAAIDSADFSSQMVGAPCTNSFGVKPPSEEAYCPCSATADAMPVTYLQADKIVAACGPSAATLPSRVYASTVQSRNTCLRKTIERATMRVENWGSASTIAQFSGNQKCVDWLGNAGTHHQWFKALQSELAVVPQPDGQSATTFLACTQTMCQAFGYSIQNDIYPIVECGYGLDQGSVPKAVYQGYFGLNTGQVNDIYGQCLAISANTITLNDIDYIIGQICNRSEDLNDAHLVAMGCAESMQVNGMCAAEIASLKASTGSTAIAYKYWTKALFRMGWALEASNIPVMCGYAKTLQEEADVSAAANKATGASVRRLPSNDHDVETIPCPSVPSAYHFLEGDGVMRFPDDQNSTESLYTQEEVQMPLKYQDMLAGLGSRDPKISEDDEPWVPRDAGRLIWGSRLPNGTAAEAPSPSEARGLQDAAAAAPAPAGVPNDVLQPWTTSSWTQCVCYQQCSAGSKSRDVTCTSDKCKSPKPPSVETCQCTHCANCFVAINLFLLYMCFLFQGASGMLLFITFYAASKVHEDDLAHISWCSCLVPLGLICKSIPVLLRVFVYINMCQVAFLFAQAFIPYLPGQENFQYDCKTNGPLVIMAIVDTCLWVAQLSYGMYMKRKSPVPAQLHAAMPRGKLRRICCIPLRSIGP